VRATSSRILADARGLGPVGPDERRADDGRVYRVDLVAGSVGAPLVGLRIPSDDFYN